MKDNIIWDTKAEWGCHLNRNNNYVIGSQSTPEDDDENKRRNYLKINLEIFYEKFSYLISTCKLITVIIHAPRKIKLRRCLFPSPQQFIRCLQS